MSCGKCLGICPERCLSLERALDMEALGRGPQVVARIEMAKCVSCGGVVAPVAMIARVRRAIEAEGGVTSQLEMCPSCRGKSLFRDVGSVVGV
ncbi:MAG: hypothetical protein NTU41_04065 [Chloroflexi bacterium]|nr:hypothetical protein [Chloroflexota bacterium]